MNINFFTTRILGLSVVVLLLLTGATTHAQTVSSATDKQAQDEVEITTQEIQIGITAFNDYDGLAYDVETRDVQIVEDGVPQTVESIRRIPASVVLLLDTGGGIAPLAKDIKLTRLAAQELAASLGAADKLSVVQFNTRVELLSDWTTDKKVVERVLDLKLSPGRASHFSDALFFAAKRFANEPRGNRHLVIFSDGVEPAAFAAKHQAALAACLKANISVHFLSYSEIAEQVARGNAKVLRPNNRTDTPAKIQQDARLRQELPPDGPAGPSAMYTMKTQGGGFSVNLDFKQRKLLKEYQRAIKISEAALQRVATETGGTIYTPKNADEMLDGTARLAREINAQYVATYKPKRPVMTSQPTDTRQIFVAAGRTGLQLRARRKYVVTQ